MKHCDTHQGSIQREEYEKQIAENAVKFLYVSGKQNNIIITVINLGKVNIHPVTFLIYIEGRWVYSPNPFATSGLENMDGQYHALAALPLGRTRKPFCRGLGVLRVGLDGHEKSHIHGIRFPHSPAVASRCIDYTVPVT